MENQETKKRGMSMWLKISGILTVFLLMSVVVLPSVILKDTDKSQVVFGTFDESRRYEQGGNGLIIEVNGDYKMQKSTTNLANQSNEYGKLTFYDASETWATVNFRTSNIVKATKNTMSVVETVYADIKTPYGTVSGSGISHAEMEMVDGKPVSMKETVVCPVGVPIPSTLQSTMIIQDGNIITNHVYTNGTTVEQKNITYQESDVQSIQSIGFVSIAVTIAACLLHWYKIIKTEHVWWAIGFELILIGGFWWTLVALF